MEELPTWFKIIIYATVGLTILYALWGMVRSIIQT